VALATVSGESPALQNHSLRFLYKVKHDNTPFQQAQGPEPVKPQSMGLEHVRVVKLLNLRHFNGGAAMRVRGFVGRQGHRERLHGVGVVG